MRPPVLHGHHTDRLQAPHTGLGGGPSHTYTAALRRRLETTLNTYKQPINTYIQPINTYNKPINTFKQPINTLCPDFRRRFQRSDVAGGVYLDHGGFVGPFYTVRATGVDGGYLLHLFHDRIYLPLRAHPVQYLSAPHRRHRKGKILYLLSTLYTPLYASIYTQLN